MKFKYRCFIENTEDSVKWLESIGYTRSLLCPKNDVIDCDILFTSIEEKTYYVTSIFSPVTTKYVDCLGNPSLFKAVSAMREDSDYMQWFITDFSNKLIPTEPMYLCKVKCFNGVLIPYQFHEDGFHIGSGGFHKATLTELQERFKEKER